MTDQQLQQLLNRLDAAAAPRGGGEPPAIDGPVIRRLARRWQIVRRTALATCSALGLAAIILALTTARLHTHPPIAQKGSGGPGEGPAPLAVAPPILDARLEVLIDAQEQVDRRRLVALTRSLGPVDLAEQRAQAARTMVFLAQRRAESAGREEALELYHRTIAMFPDTDSATLARQALAKLDRPN